MNGAENGCRMGWRNEVDAEPSEFEEQYDMADENDLNVCMLMYSQILPRSVVSRHTIM